MLAPKFKIIDEIFFSITLLSRLGKRAGEFPCTLASTIVFAQIQLQILRGNPLKPNELFVSRAIHLLNVHCVVRTTPPLDSTISLSLSCLMHESRLSWTALESLVGSFYLASWLYLAMFCFRPRTPQSRTTQFPSRYSSFWFAWIFYRHGNPFVKYFPSFV